MKTDLLAAQLAKIRRDHDAAPAPESADSSLAEGRAQFAAFLPELQDAMKIAAKRYSWDGETWALQTRMLARCIEASAYNPAVIARLAADYRGAP
jgi:hypothetical protein